MTPEHGCSVAVLYKKQNCKKETRKKNWIDNRNEFIFVPVPISIRLYVEREKHKTW